VEDTGYAFDDLKKFDDLKEMGYPSELIEALLRITKRDGEFQQEFAKQAGRHPVA
jgi:hypothetical protein